MQSEPGSDSRHVQRIGPPKRVLTHLPKWRRARRGLGFGRIEAFPEKDGDAREEEETAAAVEV